MKISSKKFPKKFLKTSHSSLDLGRPPNNIIRQPLDFLVGDMCKMKIRAGSALKRLVKKWRLQNALERRATMRSSASRAGGTSRESREPSLACYRAHIARAYFGTKYNMLHRQGRLGAQSDLSTSRKILQKGDKNHWQTYESFQT